MCGLAGVSYAVAASRDDELLRRIGGRLAHRGPDDEGRFDGAGATLLHRRLSILDPTSAGHQPMCSDDGALAILHNGEIYNFLELRDELRELGHRFRTETDTEVILAAYREWGLDFVRHFNGIWALALWDAPRATMVLSRDPFGVKPLYLAERNGDVYFASEIKALLEVPGVGRKPNRRALRDFVVHGIVDHSDDTFYAGIRRVPAGHVLTIRDGTQRAVRYWTPPGFSTDSSFEVDGGDAALVDDLRQRIVNAVALQLRSDVPIGSCLSGGIDSSTIVSVAAALRDGRLTAERRHAERDRQPQLAFFAEFREPGLDERGHVDSVVAATGVDLRTVTPTASDFADLLPVVLDQQDEPFGSASVVVQYTVMRLAHEGGVTVLLDGQGSDELFAGYLPFIGPRLGGALRNGHALGVARALRSRPALLPVTLRYALLGAAKRPGWLGGDQRPDWLGPALATTETLLRVPEAPAEGTVLSHVLWQQLTGDGLPALLRYEDRNSMAFGIEARVPFLDLPLVEFALRLPDRLKVARTRRKVALLRAMDGIVPPSVLRRTDKIAFTPPQRRWLREIEPRLRPLSVAPLTESAGYVRPGTLRTALGGLAHGGAEDALPWRLAVTEMWLRSRF